MACTPALVPGVPFGRGRRPQGLDLALGLALGLVAGSSLWLLWWRAGFGPGTFVAGLDGHGPDPLAWPRLLGVWLPVTHGFYVLAYGVLAYGILGRQRPGPGLRRAFYRDQATLAFVVPLAIGLVVVGPGGRWRLLLGGWYVAWIALKTALLLWTVWRTLRPWAADAPPVRAATIAVFVAALATYVGLGGHVVAGLSTTSDEPYYLLIAHSLLQDGDLDLANNIARHDYLPFYWGEMAIDPRSVRPGPQGELHALLYQTLQVGLLLPGYWVAGRAGAVLTMNVLAAGAMALAFGLSLAAGATVRAAFLAWLGVTFGAPLVVYSASPFPEVSGAFFATAAATLLWRARGGAARQVAATLCLAAMVATKIRFAVLLPALALAFAPRLTRRGLLAGGLGAVAGLALAVAYAGRAFSRYVTWNAGAPGFRAALAWLVGWTWRAPGQYRGQLALLLDQEFGLLPAAPIFVLGLVGLAVAAAERRVRLLLLAGGPFVVSWYYLGAADLGALSHRGVSQWYGGFSPPARFLVAALPLLSVLVALALDRLRGWLAWTGAVALVVPGLGYAAVLSTWPAWRFQAALGRPTVLQHLFHRTGLDPGAFLPSFLTGGDRWIGPSLVALAIPLVAGLGLARRTGGPPPRGAAPAGLLAAVVGVVALIGWAWWRPPTVHPLVLGQGRGGAPFLGRLDVDDGAGTARPPRLVWAAQRDAGLELAPRLPPHRYRLTIRAGAQGVGGPTLAVTAGGVVLAPVEVEAAPAPVWRERDYQYEIGWGGGRLPIRLELRGVIRGPSPRLAYLDTIRIDPLGP